MNRTQTAVVSSAFVTAIGMGVQGVARFGYTWAIARFVGPIEVGQVNALLSVAVYAALVWPQGAAVAAARFLPVPRESAAAITWLRRSVLVASALLALAGGVVGWILLRDAFAAVSCAVLVATYSGYCFARGVLFGRGQIIRGAVWDAVSSVISLAALVLVILGALDWALLYPLSAGYLAFALMNWPQEEAVQPPRDFARQIGSFTRASCIAALASGGLLPSTMIAVQAFDTPSVAGNFAVAMSLATPANMLALALNQVLVPHFSRMRSGTPEEARASHLRIFIVSSVGLLLIFGALIALAPWILSLFFGDVYAAGTSTMRVLLGIVCVLSLMSVPGAYLMAMGHQRLYATVWIISFVIGSLVLFFASPTLGQWGALIGYGVGGCGGSVAVIVAALTLRPRIRVDNVTNIPL